MICSTFAFDFAISTHSIYYDCNCLNIAELIVSSKQH